RRVTQRLQRRVQRSVDVKGGTRRVTRRGNRCGTHSGVKYAELLAPAAPLRGDCDGARGGGERPGRTPPTTLGGRAVLSPVVTCFVLRVGGGRVGWYGHGRVILKLGVCVESGILK